MTRAVGPVTSRVHPDLGLGLGLLDLLLELLKSPHVEFDPLARVGDGGVLQQGTEHHEEAHSEVDIKRLHVGDFRQGASKKNQDHL